MNGKNSFISASDPIVSHLQPADLVSWERRDGGHLLSLFLSHLPSPHKNKPYWQSRWLFKRALSLL